MNVDARLGSRAFDLSIASVALWLIETQRWASGNISNTQDETADHRAFVDVGRHCGG